MLLYTFLLAIVLLATVCQADSSSSESSSSESENSPTSPSSSSSSSSSSDAMAVIRGLVDSGDGSDLYELITCVGHGASGRVYKAQLKGGTTAKDGRLRKSGISVKDAAYGQQFVAVKVVPLCEETLDDVSRELRILKRVGRHMNVMHFLSAHLHRGGDHWAVASDEGGSSRSSSSEASAGLEKSMVDCSEYLWIVSEWIQGDNLGFYIDSHAKAVRLGSKSAAPVFSLSDTRRIAHGLVAGLNHLHSRGCTHGDVDASNVMLGNTAAVFVDPGNGRIDDGEDEMGLDTLCLVVIVVEMSVSQRHGASEEGPVSAKRCGELDAEEVSAFLKSVAEGGSYEVPEEVRQFVEFALENVGEKTHCAVLASHPFLK